MDLGLEGRTAVVLASSGGLGRAVAASLLHERARVAISGRDGDRLRRTLADLADHGDRVFGESLDVTDTRALTPYLNAVEQRLGPIDVLVWNSGGPPPASATEVDGEAADAAYGMLLRPAVHAIRHVLPGMRERGFGRILAMTSIAVRQPIPSLALSNVMRSGLTAYLKSLSQEVARDGVLVNSVCTGIFDTDRVRRLMAARAERSGRTPDAEAADTVAEIPAGRFGRPEEFGDFVAFLVSERASYFNGVAVPLDGGLSRALL